MLKIENLNKYYGSFKALDNLSLEINKGDIFGFIGPNGAGKSTTMKIVSGLMLPDSGSVYVDGIDAIKNNRELKEKIGYMPDFFGVYDNLKAIEYLEFFASIYDIFGKEARDLSMDLLELVNLRDKSEAYVDGLSRGMKQRLCLARCLIHNPELLILDEPASGMDPRARFEMKGILKNLKDMNKTVIISSHILPELSEICNKVGIIEGGSMKTTGTIEEIMNSALGNDSISIRVLDKVEETVRILKEVPNIIKVSFEENNIKTNFNGSQEDIAMILKRLVNENIPVIGFEKSTRNLEDVFIKITEKEEV